MDTPYNKAVVALLVPVLTWMNQKWGLALPVDGSTLGILVSAVTGFLVWLVPNKTA